MWYCKINFLTFNCFYAQRISKSTTARPIALLWDDITKSDNSQIKQIKKLWNTLNSKFSVQPVNGISSKCLSVLGTLMCWCYKNSSRFLPLSKFPKWMIIYWFFLYKCAVPTTDIFFLITWRLKNKRSATGLSQRWILRSFHSDVIVLSIN